jgi:hypothetical protein
VTLTVYLDESSGDHPYLACGWAATPERWKTLSADWRRALGTERRLKYFRMNAALGLKDAFVGWTEPERDKKLIALAQAIPHDGTVFGVGCHLIREDFEKIRARIPRKIYRDPYYFCVTTAMIFLAAGEQQIVGADKLDFVLDKSTSAERMTRLFYSDIKSHFPKLGECSTMDDQETLPLQAADMAAGFVRQLYEPSPRTIRGCYALKGLFSGVFEIYPKALEDIVSKLPSFAAIDPSR